MNLSMTLLLIAGYPDNLWDDEIIERCFQHFDRILLREGVDLMAINGILP
jgi:hypothetical protein